MVNLTRCLGYATKKPIRRYLRSGFLDSLKIQVKGGTGGQGIPRYGGTGGQGGNVIAIAKEGISLNRIVSKHKELKFVAETGYDSSLKGLLGKPGQDLVLEVPPGVTILNQYGTVLGEVNEPGSQVVIAKGGIGGCPETGFSGRKGDSLTVVLDLKLIADIGLVGFPNAGKSSLLRAVSKAKPKVASYPFTTMKPQLGTMEYKDHRKITIADLPGLIEGAHANVGLGHRFLKHLSRTKLLLFIVDIEGFQLSVKHEKRSCLETIVLLNKEVELYKPDLLDMPSVLIINKMDTEGASDKFKSIRKELANFSTFVSNCQDEIRPERVLNFLDVIPTALIKKNVDEIDFVKQRLRHFLDKIVEQEEFELAHEDVEGKLVEKISRQTKQIAPVLL